MILEPRRVQPQKFLIDNPLGVGDQTDSTYPDGNPVYGDQRSNDDGSFQVLIPPTDKQPPANWTSNWRAIFGLHHHTVRAFHDAEAESHGLTAE
ncbi:hypothetical protein BDV40DRAFT_299330 [Aspergillus tamarii]|uniref:Uncharacterized protein n=1 Tax=Aspergillus tamarii TaxID=41984 RepID=A0A5N6UY31_ASPTM|nr:hypothetical protein BDV40DRAFT_299330 [Aspergillus tamarii]